MTKGYDSHYDYMNWVKNDADSRKRKIENAIKKSFANYIEIREVEVIIFSTMSAIDLAKAISAVPFMLKSLLACCNIAGRAIERDLNIKNLNTYEPRFNEDQSKVIAGYIKPFLPTYLEINALSSLDRIYFIDKEIRKLKGRWEQNIKKALNSFSSLSFEKRKFEVDGEPFEIDAAYPLTGEIKIGIDVKRIEARRDIHKRCDEIVNKANKLKSVCPNTKFGAVIYYPFPEEHINVQSRLRSPNIDSVVFASSSIESINNAVQLLISSLK